MHYIYILPPLILTIVSIIVMSQCVGSASNKANIIATFAFISGVCLVLSILNVLLDPYTTETETVSKQIEIEHLKYSTFVTFKNKSDETIRLEYKELRDIENIKNLGIDHVTISNEFNSLGVNLRNTTKYKIHHANQ